MNADGLVIRWGSKDHWINSLWEKTIVFVGIYNKQILGDYFSNGLWLPGVLVDLHKFEAMFQLFFAKQNFRILVPQAIF